MTSSSDVIDLTNSFTLADHCVLSDIVIDLATDDSLYIDINCPNDSWGISSVSASVIPSIPTAVPTLEMPIKKKKLKRKTSLIQRKSDPSSPIESGRKRQFGGCPICWDELGKNPLASTKCGHVYCMKCIQEYLNVQKRCPTCRRSLKGTSAYHPLYLSG